jgi:hypothetical protein
MRSDASAEGADSIIGSGRFSTGKALARLLFLYNGLDWQAERYFS